MTIRDYSEHYYTFDINNDGVIDFQFGLAYPYMSPAGGSNFCIINGLNNNKIAFANYDSCFNDSGSYIERFGMAYAFQYNDTINSNANWVDSTYLTNSGWWIPSSSPGGSCYFDFSPGDTAYLGVRAQVDSTYEYGWIKIAGITWGGESLGTLTMGIFACESNNTDIKQKINNNGQITVSPNPASSEIKVISNQLTVIGIDIYNMLGEKVYTSPPTDNRSPITINVSSFPSGMYFVKIKSEKGVVVKKFIKE
jgi:hypothetical protein